MKSVNKEVFGMFWNIFVVQICKPEYDEKKKKIVKNIVDEVFSDQIRFFITQDLRNKYE